MLHTANKGRKPSAEAESITGRGNSLSPITPAPAPSPRTGDGQRSDLIPKHRPGAPAPSSVASNENHKLKPKKQLPSKSQQRMAGGDLTTSIH